MPDTFKRIGAMMSAALLSTAFVVPAAHAAEPWVCGGSGEYDVLEHQPEAGRVLTVSNPWITVSGHLPWSDASVASFSLVARDTSNPVDGDAITPRTLEARAHTGFQVEGLEPGEYDWKMDDAWDARRFAVSTDAVHDDVPPTFESGVVEVAAEYERDMLWEDNGIEWRVWTLSFPAADDLQTPPEHMRVLVRFSWTDDGEEMSAALVEKPRFLAGEGRYELVLGSGQERCKASVPSVVPEGTTVQVTVYAIDDAGNVSVDGVTGTVEQPARPDDGPSGPGDGTHPGSDDLPGGGEETDDPSQADDEAGGCSTSGALGTGDVAPIVVLVGAAGVVRISRRRGEQR